MVKLHIIGLAGSGKTTLANWASAQSGVPAVDLDFVVYTPTGERPRAELLDQLDEIRSRPQWITEGAYHDASLHPLLADAEVILWIDTPTALCILRIVKRHVVAELRGDNEHSGWRRLWRFLDYTRRTAAEQRAATGAMLTPYAVKVRRCRSAGDLRRTKDWLAGAV